jgi:hypothetical protein
MIQLGRVGAESGEPGWSFDVPAATRPADLVIIGRDPVFANEALAIRRGIQINGDAQLGTIDYARNSRRRAARPRRALPRASGSCSAHPQRPAAASPAAQPAASPAAQPAASPGWDRAPSWARVASPSCRTAEPRALVPTSQKVRNAVRQGDAKRP